jgi:hypothetical protein
MVSWMGLNYTSEQFSPPGMWWSSTIWRATPAPPSAPAAALPAPAAAPPVPTIEPVLDNNVSVSVYGRVIPISAGKRRLPGDLIWLKKDQLNTDGQYTASAAYSFGYRLIAGASATLVKLWANGVKIYDATTGFTAEGLSFVVYDGSQTAVDPEIAADKGAAITPAYKHQLYIRGIFPTKEFNGMLPNISALFEDDPSGYRTFIPWSNVGSDETLNPDDCELPDIELSNGNLTAERVEPDPDPSPHHWASVRSTKGRPANQADGHGWFVFEARNDHVSVYPEGPAIFPMDYQGPGLTTELSGGTAGGTAGDANSLMAKVLGGFRVNGTETGVLFGTQMLEGDWAMIAVRLDLMKLWTNHADAASDWVNGIVGDPVEGIGGLDVSFMGGHTIYPVWWSAFLGQKGTFNFTGPFVNVGPSGTSGGGITSASTLPEIIVAVGARCGFDITDFSFTGLEHLKVTGVVITTDTDFLSFLKNAGRVYGYDYTESGGQILVRKAVIGTTYAVDIDDIPESSLIPTSQDAAVTTTRDNSHRPEIIEIQYQDETIDYQPSTQRARIPRIQAPVTDKFGIPFVMSAQEALTGASTALYREQSERVTHSFQLPFQFQPIEPTDIIQFTSSGKAYTAKVTGVTRNSDLSIKVTAANLLTAEAEPIEDDFAGENYEDYHGGGSSGDPNIDNVPLAVITPVLNFSKRGSSASVVLLEDI